MTKLEEIQQDPNVALYLKKVKQVIARTLRKSVPEVEEYVTSTFGKHIRSTLFFLTVKALNSKTTVPPEIGAAFEILHTATLMHDDVLDKTSIRRGKKSFQALYGTNFSVLAGDLLVCAALKLIWEIKSWRFVKLYSELGQNLVKGEVAGTHLSVSSNISKYYAQIYLKTACFFETICKMSAAITKASKSDSETIINFGMMFGRSFQIHDDYTDYFVHTAIADKQQGGDFYNKIITIPLIYAYRKSDFIEKQLISTAIQNPTVAGFKMVVKIMKKLNVNKMVLEDLRLISEQLQQLISSLKDTKYKNLLIEMTRLYISY